LEMEFHGVGREARGRAQVGLYFAPSPGKPLASLELPALFGFGAGIDIPAGESQYVVRDAFTLPADVIVHAAWAHAHYLGNELEVDATPPGGPAAPLFSIRGGD